MTKQKSDRDKDKQLFGERIIDRLEQQWFDQAYQDAFDEKPDYLTHEYEVVNQYLATMRGKPFSE